MSVVLTGNHLRKSMMGSVWDEIFVDNEPIEEMLIRLDQVQMDTALEEEYPPSAYGTIYTELNARSLEWHQAAREYLKKYLNHDCMWSGYCANKSDDTINVIVNVSTAPTPTVATAKKVTTTAVVASSASRSLLINSRNNQTVATNVNVVKHDHSFTKTDDSPELGVRPETPATSEDELQEVLEFIQSEKSMVLKTLTKALQENGGVNFNGYFDYDEFGDLARVDLTESQEEILTSSSSEFSSDESEDDIPQLIYQRSAESDHCYHLSKEPVRRLEHLGVDTPSDSEEEIDVVSVYGETSHHYHQMARSNLKAPLPTNPSAYDRRNLQKSVASAINKRPQTGVGGIRTRGPMRAAPPASPHNVSEPGSPSGKEQQQQLLPTGGGKTGNGGPQRGTPKKRCASNDGKVGKGAKRVKLQQTVAVRQRATRRRVTGESESDCDSDKRNQHNDMERQRRVDLRNAFEDLRVLVPSVCNKDRAAKVHILRESAAYCESVAETDEALRRTKAELKRHQDVLMQRVSQLRRMLAAKR